MNASPSTTKRLNDFKYLSPGSLTEAVDILNQSEKQAVIMAGGTDVLVMTKARVITPGILVSMINIPGLSDILESDQEIRIGALTVVADLLKSKQIQEKCSALAEAAREFATPHVRNMATIGGNICRSSPGGDLLPPLMAMDARLTIVGPDGERIQPIGDFITGPGLNTLDREILTGITLPHTSNQSSSAFGKITRNTSDLAKINCAVFLEKTGVDCSIIRIVLGAVADRPVRLPGVEQALEGKALTPALIESAVVRTDDHIAPITDARSTADYRRKVSRVLTSRTILKAWETLN